MPPTAHFSSCWEKWADGDIKKKLLGTATRRRQEIPSGKDQTAVTSVR